MHTRGLRTNWLAHALHAFRRRRKCGPSPAAGRGTPNATDELYCTVLCSCSASRTTSVLLLYCVHVSMYVCMYVTMHGKGVEFQCNLMRYVRNLPHPAVYMPCVSVLCVTACVTHQKHGICAASQVQTSHPLHTHTHAHTHTTITTTTTTESVCFCLLSVSVPRLSILHAAAGRNTRTHAACNDQLILCTMCMF